MTILPMRAVIIIAALMVSPAIVANASENRAPVVETPAGSVRGVERENLQIFLGIPYAAPPMGERRWKPPVQMTAFGGVYDATEFGAACMQPTSRPGSIYAEKYSKMSEDCLTLNIWKPHKAENAAVFVWIHGGSLMTGAGGLPMYDGEKLAKHGVIVVSINYRLGIFGYLAHQDLSAESPDGVSGNYGLLDQIAALEWIKRNISAFGGDPGKVTIAGESAGALSVMYLMASPAARGLFSKAIAQSAYMITTPELKEQAHGVPSAEAAGAYVAEKIGAGDIAAMRAMDAEKLMDEAAKAGYAPFGSVDGVTLPRQLVETFDRGEQAPVPVLSGFNSGEIRSLRFLLPPAPKDAAAYEAEIRARYGELSDTFLKLYPSSDIEESMLATTRDAMYGWTAQRLAEKQTEIGAESYFYLFDHGYPAADEAGLHGFHASEIPYIFGTVDETPALWPKPPKSALERKLSKAMMQYWTSFARTGAPEAEGQDSWPSFGADEGFMRFTDAPHAGTGLFSTAYRLHEEVVCRRRGTGAIPWNWNVGIISPPLPPQPSDGPC